MEYIYEYGLFLAKAITFVVAALLIVGFVVGAAMKQKQGKKGELNIEYLTEQFNDDIDDIKKSMMSKEELKNHEKQIKAQEKQDKRSKKKQKGDEPASPKSRVFVVSFDGDVEASSVESLREEVTAIVSIAQPNDRVVIKLESPGGMVHGYGLAASQIKRLTSRGIKVTASVDKVAASGGYMMACVADEIISAPFAIIGSIGVVAQLPNINKLLKKHDVEIEQHTAGEFKRTLTVMGENTDKAREKFKEELEETHVLFKQFVSENRPIVDIDRVATGEHWYGIQAKELNLIDDVKTSDDLILELHQDNDVYSVEYKIKHNIAEKLGVAVSTVITKTIGKFSTWSITHSK